MTHITRGGDEVLEMKGLGLPSEWTKAHAGSQEVAL